MRTKSDKSKKNSFTPEPIAIIGMGALFPEADGLNTYWANIKKGLDTIKDIPESHWKVEDYYSPDQQKPDHTHARRGGFIPEVEFDPFEFNIPPSALEATDTSQLLGLYVAKRALEDAGYGENRQYDRNRVGVILGVTGALPLVSTLGSRLAHPKWRQALKDAGVDEKTAADVVERIAESFVPWQENSFPGLLGNVVSGRISNYLDLGGTNCVVDAACASSFSALHLSMMELQAGRSNMVVSGGIDTFNDIFMYMCFSKTHAMSPTSDARPFDTSSDGTILGEGLGIVILKRLSDAKKDGDNVYAVIKSVGTSSDGKGNAIYAPSASGQVKALRDAYSQAGIDPVTIELIEAHGTGTRVGDGVEISALKEVYGKSENGPWCAIGSVKSQIGHTKAGAGAAGLIKAAMALYTKTLPGTIKVKQPLEQICQADSPFYINSYHRPWIRKSEHKRRAAVSAFGFGGSNFHCVLEEYDEVKSKVDWDPDVEILAFSGQSRSDMIQALRSVDIDSGWDKLALAAFQSRSVYSNNNQCRLVIVLRKDGYRKMIEKVLSRLQSEDNSWSMPQGAFYYNGTGYEKVAVVFPGQGAQYPDMLRDLSCGFGEMTESLEMAEQTLSGDTDRLCGYIYPIPRFDGSENDLKALTRTDIAQSALAAVCAGAWKTVKGFGLAADAFAGHSFGELVALYAAGKIDEVSLYKLAAKRGKLMHQADDGSGGMIAVLAEKKIVEQIIRDSKLKLIIANLNGPEQFVLSGPRDQLQKAHGIFEEKKIRSVILDVSAAFHTQVMEGASEKFREFTEGIRFYRTDTDVFSNTTSKRYPLTAKASKNLLARQLSSPVDFNREIENMYADGIRIFVEIGPGSRMGGLVSRILNGKDVTVMSLDQSSGKDSGFADLAGVLGRLSAMGYDISLNKWNEGLYTNLLSRKKPKMVVKLCGENYVQPRKKRPPAEKKAATDTAYKERPVRNESREQEVIQENAVPDALANTLMATQQNLAMLQKVQVQTAQLHQQFLQNQQTAARTLQALISQRTSIAEIESTGLSSVQVDANAMAQPTANKPEADRLSADKIPQESQDTDSHKDIHADDRQSIEKSSVSDKTRQVLLEVISEKTGYPVEMLDMDMSLDADLGIDSIKRVEILSSLQERLPEAPKIESQHLGKFHSLEDIIDFISVDDISSEPVSSVAGSPVYSNDISSVLLDTISEKTGYPVEMLDMGMSLDADLGIDSIKRVEILSAIQERLPYAPRIESQHLGQFHTLNDIIEFIGISDSPNTPVNSDAGASDASGILLDTISEKTGYPVEMLDMGMSLDADLGIDSIKRVEILSSLQERLPEAPKIESQHLGQFHTLNDIIEFIGISDSPNTPVNSEAGVSDASGILLDTISEKTGYPVEMLDMGMSLDADLGIDSIKRVEILSAIQERLPNAPKIESHHLGQFNSLQDIVDYISSTGEKSAPEVIEDDTPNQHVKQQKGTIERMTVLSVPAEKPAGKGVINITKKYPVWVRGNDLLSELIVRKLIDYGFDAKIIDETYLQNVPDKLSGLIITGPDAMTDNDIYQSFDVLNKTSGSLVNTSEEGAFFAAVSRMDGQFGMSGKRVFSEISGGLAGMAKTAYWEWPNVTCRAIDVSVDTDINEGVAEDIIAQILYGDEIEYGIDGKEYYRPGIRTESLDEDSCDFAFCPIQAGDVVVVSGGARGVTSEAAKALARKFQPTLILLGRSRGPSQEPSWIVGLSEESDIKRAILDRTPGLKPKQMQEMYSKFMSNRQMLANIKQMQDAGSIVEYYSVDIKDHVAVSKVLCDVRHNHGQIKGIVHGAGVLADRLIRDKTVDQFRRVYETKVCGIRSLLENTLKDDLKLIVMYSSSTGRFGRKGQVDYAVANEILNKTARIQAVKRSGCKVLSVNWGPWDGGMVDESLRSVFLKEGIGLIDLQSGSEYLLREICNRVDRNIEIVVTGSPLPVKEYENWKVPDQEKKEDSSYHLVHKYDVSVKTHPFMASHVINDRAVVPVAVMVEWVALAALHSNPGLRFYGIDNFQVYKGITIDPDDLASLEIYTTKPQSSNGSFIVNVRVKNSADRNNVINISADVILTDILKGDIPKLNWQHETLSPYRNNGNSIYNDLLFHGSLFQCLEDVKTDFTKYIHAKACSSPKPSEWMHNVIRDRWIADPLALDAGFQMMILWSRQTYNAGSLPVKLGRYRQYKRSFPRQGTEIKVEVQSHNEHKATAVIEFIDPATKDLIASIEDYECVIDESLNTAFKKNTIKADAGFGA